MILKALSIICDPTLQDKIENLWEATLELRTSESKFLYEAILLLIKYAILLLITITLFITLLGSLITSCAVVLNQMIPQIYHNFSQLDVLLLSSFILLIFCSILLFCTVILKNKAKKTFNICIQHWCYHNEK